MIRECVRIWVSKETNTKTYGLIIRQYVLVVVSFKTQRKVTRNSSEQFSPENCYEGDAPHSNFWVLVEEWKKGKKIFWVLYWMITINYKAN